MIDWGTSPARSTKARITPGTSWILFNTRCTCWRKTAESSPNSLITIWPSIWEMLSSTLSRIGCENVVSIPGNAASARSISSIIFSLGNPGRQREVHPDGAFVQFRQKFRPHFRGDGQAGGQRDDRRAQHELAMIQRPVERRSIQPLAQPDQEVFLAGQIFAKQEI